MSFLVDVPLDPSEQRRLRRLIALVLLAIVLPYAWAIAITPPGAEYGGLLYNPDDQNVHLAWARQAAQGHFFLRDLFTTEGLSSGQAPLFTNLFCWFMGVVSRVLHVPLIGVYHALRLLFAALALAWFYALCSRLTEDKRLRFLAVVLAAFSAGAGWMQSILPGLLGGRIFIDRPDGPLMMPEAFIFTSALVFPLNIASVALLALIYALVLQAQQTGELRAACIAGATAFLLTNIHTYDALPLDATMLIWAGLNWPSPPAPLPKLGEGSQKQDANRMRWQAPLIVIAGTLPPLLYQWIVFQKSEEFRLKAVTPTPAPPLLDVLLSYGPLILLAAAGAVLAWREPRSRLMVIWALVTLCFIYAPVSFARKMIEGLHLPLCFLAATGLLRLAARAPSALSQRAIIASVAGVLCISSLQFVNWCLANAGDNNSQRGGIFMPPLYLTRGDASALRFLATSPDVAHNRAVLSWPKVGNYGPRETGRHFYIGHWAETLHPGRKLEATQRFYSGAMSQNEALAWLRENHIGYVIEGFYERAFAQANAWLLPSQRLPLQRIFNENGTAVYAVPQK